MVERTGYDTWPGHYVEFLASTLYSHNASLNLGEEMGTSKLSVKHNKTLREGGRGGGNIDQHPTEKQYKSPCFFLSKTEAPCRSRGLSDLEIYGLK